MNSSAGTAKENDLAAEVPSDPGLRQPDRRAEHTGNLRVVAAAVCSACGWIGQRVLGRPQTVEFADDGHARPRRRTGKPSLDTGQRQAGARRQPESMHALCDESRGLYLVEAGFWVAKDRLAEFDDCIGSAVDRFANRQLQLVLAAHWGSTR